MWLLVKSVRGSPCSAKLNSSVGILQRMQDGRLRCLAAGFWVHFVDLQSQPSKTSPRLNNLKCKCAVESSFKGC